MAMNAGFDLVTLVNGVGTITWRHPEQRRDGTGAEAVELDGVPQFFWITPTANTLLAVGVVKVEAVTAIGGRLVSTHNSDSSTYQVVGFVDLPEALFRGSR